MVLESAEVAAQQDDRDVSQEHNEIWQHYLNDSPPRSRDPGDSRAAVTPFLAHQVCADLCCMAHTAVAK